MGSTRKYLATALLGFATVAGVLLPAAAAQAAPALPKNVNIHVDEDAEGERGPEDPEGPARCARDQALALGRDHHQAAEPAHQVVPLEPAVPPRP